jgi:hypothetical protein
VSGELYTEAAKNGELCNGNFEGGARAGQAAEGRQANRELSLLLTDVYVDVLAPNLDCITADAYCRIGRQLPGRYVVFPTVPRTYDDLAFELSFAQRAAAMQADVIDCK